jgi:GT2 family glycosyltransferase
MDPRITVVISTFNSDTWLRECLEQLCKQTAIDLCEVVVIDSGSDKDEAVVCRELSPKFPNLIYDRTDRETLYAAWNRGLSRARGQYFVNVNTDDALAPDSLECFVEAMEKESAAALAYADCVWSPLPNASHPWPDTWKHVRYESYAAEAALFYSFTSCTQFWRVSALRTLGGFDPSLRAVGDYEALCRMVNKGMRAVHIPRILSAFYQNPHGLSQKSTAANAEFLRVRVRFRDQVDLSKIFPVDAADTRSRRGAHLSLAMRALDPRIPWHETPHADVDYATRNLQDAANHSKPLRSMLLRWTASMLARGHQGSILCKKISQLLLSRFGLLLLHGKRLPRAF